MNKIAKIADGLASWLNFELRAGREDLFSESYLAQPLGQLLQYRYKGRLRSEVEHPVLSILMNGRGKRPRVDFAIKSIGEIYDLVIETKWVSKSPTLLRDIISDIIRLDLLIPKYAKEGLLICAGKKRDFDDLFNDPQFKPFPNDPKSSYLLSIDNYEKASVRFVPTPKFRQPLLESVLDLYKDKDVLISKSIKTERSGPYPCDASNKQYEVYIWKVRNFGNENKFMPFAESCSNVANNCLIHSDDEKKELG